MIPILHKKLIRPSFVPLKYRFILLSSVLLITLFGLTAAALVAQQSTSIRRQVEARGLAIAQSLAATSRGALAIYNYIAMEQTAGEAAKNPDVLQVIIHDKEGRVAGFSHRSDLQGTFLADPWTHNALNSEGPLVQERPLENGGAVILDCAAPVHIEGSQLRWGTVRVIVSLEPMHQQIRMTQGIVIGIGILAVAIGMGTAGWTANRITRPLQKLTEATMEAAQGNLNQVIEVHTHDEVEILAKNFSSMIGEILDQRRRLVAQLNEIKNLQRYTQSLLNTMNDGLFSTDSHGRLGVMNPAASRLLRIDAQSGTFLNEILEDSPQLLQYVDEMLHAEDRVLSQREIRILPEGQPRFLLVNSSRLLNPDGTLQELITNLQDVTEFKDMEARMRRTERLAALGTLAAGMAHEIRNPLSAIKTFVQLLPRKLEKPQFLEKFNRTVPRELERINGLVEDLLEFSREAKFRFEQTDIRPLVREAFELLEEQMKLHAIDGKMRVSDMLPMVLADADQLNKVFHNLLRNAIQAMPDGGALTVEVFREQREYASAGAGHRPPGKGWVCVRFSDTGRGIDQEDLSHIFNPFFTTKDNGTGLGLAITHKVVTEHGGHIEVHSDPGKGAVFTVLLPAVNGGCGQLGRLT